VDGEHLQFLGYTVDTVHRNVTAPAGRVVRLEPKTCDLLLYFAAHRGEVLSREQLIADVWKGKFVTDDAVMVAVYALRQAFDDDSRTPRFIETIRGRGYRWIAPPSEPSGATGSQPVVAQVDGLRARRSRWRRYALIAAVLLIVAGPSLREPRPMPSMQRTAELVRANARGLFFNERRTRADLEQAAAEFRKAIKVDDRFAEPHAGLAEVSIRLIEIGSRDVAEHERVARREVAIAFAQAPHLALSHAARASLQFVVERDVARAEESFRHAIRLDPSLPGIHQRYSYLLSATARFDEAIEQARIATELQPTSSSAFVDLAWANMVAGKAADAESFYREAIRLDPANSGALFGLGYCLEVRNAPDEAMQSYRRALQILGTPDAAITRLERTFTASGLQGVYASWLELYRGNDAIPRSAAAYFAARAGRVEEAMALLREATVRREAGTLWLAVHPAFTPYRGQREFDALVASSFHTR